VQWVDRLQEVTGWQRPRRECEWTATESELGTSFPVDYKEICARFGPGYFSSFFSVLRDDGETMAAQRTRCCTAGGASSRSGNRNRC
jgi:hypothetical protein